jgi:hypothetical protein
MTRGVDQNQTLGADRRDRRFAVVPQGRIDTGDLELVGVGGGPEDQGIVGRGITLQDDIDLIDGREDTVAIGDQNLTKVIA